MTAPGEPALTEEEKSALHTLGSVGSVFGLPLEGVGEIEIRVALAQAGGVVLFVDDSGDDGDGPRVEVILSKGGARALHALLHVAEDEAAEQKEALQAPPGFDHGDVARAAEAIRDAMHGSAAT